MKREGKNFQNFQQIADKYARNSLRWIREEVGAMEHARECRGSDGNGHDCRYWEDEDGKRHLIAKAERPEDFHDEDKARQAIEEGPLSVEVRSGWHTPGVENAKPDEYNILLGTGGPAARIVGDLDEYCQPTSAHYEYQDWFKPWTRARLSGSEEDVLLKYAQVFYFGE